MTRHLDPYREFQDWLADGPTSWSDQSLDTVIRRVAVTPQQRRSHRPWELNPRRVLYAVAGLAAVVIIVAVAWAVLSGQLLPPNPPPVSTPEPSVRTSAPRSDGNSALLDDGRVLVVSGAWEGMGERVAAVTQLWDPNTGSVVATGRPIGGRVESTATALYDGRVLVVGGYAGPIPYTNAIASAELWDPATESFAPAGSMSERRALHTATLLIDGRVLVVGGSSEGASWSAELWDPASGAFHPLPPLSFARRGHTATLLSDGRVLVVGGAHLGGSLASAELWDPGTGAFSATGSLAHERSLHTATLLHDGRVLIVGGEDSRNRTPLASAEVWDPATGTFAAAGTLAQARVAHAAAPLTDGRVFFFAGNGASPPSASVEFWDPTAATFRTAAPLPHRFFNPSAVLLADGRRVLVVGFIVEPDGPTSAVIYDAGAGGASQASPSAMRVCHWDLPTGVLAEVERTGAELGVAVSASDYAATQGDIRRGVDAFSKAGCDLIVARVFSPEQQAGAAEALAANPEQRAVVVGYQRYQGRDLPNVLWVSLSADFTRVAVSDAIGRVVDGTFQGGSLSESGLATPAPPFTSSRPPKEGPFSPTGLLAQTGGRGDWLLLPDGRVLVLNRVIPMGTRGTQVFDPVRGTAALTGQPGVNRFESTATLLRDGRVLVVGGVLGRPDLPAPEIASAEIWDPATAAFTATDSMGEARRNHTATLLSDGRVLVVGGGYDEGAPAVYGLKSHSLATAEIWDPATGLFSPTGPMAEARQLHSATLLADGRVLIVGGSIREEGQAETSVASAEIWDPATGLFTRAGSLMYERSGHTATLLPDGGVLIVGGSSAEIWDPDARTFDQGGASSWPSGSVAVLVPDGRVLFFGVNSGEGSGSIRVEQWDSASGAYSAAPSLTVPISPEAAAVLDGGRVLLIGTANSPDIAVVVYDPRHEQ